MRALLLRLGLDAVQFDPEAGWVSFEVRRLSRLRSGDRVVLFSRDWKVGARFEWIGTVIDYDAKPANEGDGDDDGLRIQVVRLRDVEQLPSDRTLDLLGPSLVIVRNPRKPADRCRHRRYLSQLDVETIESGGRNVGRTLYFGLLNALPRAWSERLGRAAWASFEWSQRMAGKSTLARPRDGVPVEQLLDFLEGYVVPTVRMASAIRGLETEHEVHVLLPEEERAWSVTSLGSLGPRLLPEITGGLDFARDSLRDAEGSRTDGSFWADLRLEA